MDITRQFLSALRGLEREGNIEEIVALFRAQCDVGNVISPNVFIGRQGARDYWSVYRNWFGEIESTVHRVIYSDQHAAIEWSSRGTRANGLHISYEGVSLLEFTDGEISRFRAYFNPAHLARRVRPAQPVSRPFAIAFAHG